MAKEHQECIQDAFGKKAVLFNEVCFNQNKSVDDIEDALSDWQNKTPEVKVFMKETINYIDSSMPKFIENMEKYF